MMYQVNFNHPVWVHFIGIGGISMSGLAHILLGAGFRVTGSDNKESELTCRLIGEGAEIFYGQKAENIDPAMDVVVYTAAVHPDNPEYKRCTELNLPMLTRAQLLGEVMNNYDASVAVSGTHGKTTTTSMISEIALKADLDPTISVGGMLRSIDGNIRVGHSPLFIAEACEYSNSFLSLYPKIAVILDIDADHLDFFKDLNDIRHSFHIFAQHLPANGTLIINASIEKYQEIISDAVCSIVTYGLDRGDYHASDIRFDTYGCGSFTLIRRGKNAGRFTLRVPGIHNVSNAVASLAAADLIGADLKAETEGLDNFTGTDRRFERKGEVNGFTVIDDYAHHPTEIRATLTAARNYPHEKIWCIFQPHTYTRTKALMDEFADALTLADEVVLADIYAAREKDNLGISSDTLRERIARNNTPVHYFPSFGQIEDYILQNAHTGDLVITMGAGDVYKVGDELLKKSR